MKTKQFVARMLLCSVALLGCTNVAAKSNTPKETMELKILATTDTHNYLMNYDYYTTSQSNKYGFVKLATLIKEYQAETPGVEDYVLLDNGDNLQGNPLGDYFNKVNPVKAGTNHPIYEAFEALGYDAMGLGNHEFDYGLDYLHQVINDTNIPVLNSNVFNANTKEEEFKPYVILDKEVVDSEGNIFPVKVGVLSVVPEQILNWAEFHLAGKVTVQDMKKAVKNNVQKLKEEGADVVVVLAHTGYGANNYIEGAEHVAAALTKVKGVDVVIGGHSHDVFPSKDIADTLKKVDVEKGTINGKPSVQPGKYAEGLGVVTLKFRKVNDKKIRLIDGSAEYVSAAGVENDPEIEELFQPYHQEVIDYVSAPVGRIESPLQSFFSLVRDDATIQVVADAQIEYVQELVKTAPELKAYKELPILSASAPFKAGLSKGEVNPDDYVDIEAGSIAIKDVSSLYKYPNTLSILKLTGKEVKEWLEMSAGMFNQIEEGKENQELLSDYPTFKFDTIDGVTYEIDVTQPNKYDSDGNVVNASAERIVNLQYKGEPVEETQEFLVISNNFRASGGGNFPIFTTGKELVYSSVDENRQIVSNYIASQGTFRPSADNNWKLKTLAPGTTATFVSNSKGTTLLANETAITAGREVGTNLTEFVYDLSK